MCVLVAFRKCNGYIMRQGQCRIFYMRVYETDLAFCRTNGLYINFKHRNSSIKNNHCEAVFLLRITRKRRGKGKSFQRGGWEVTLCSCFWWSSCLLCASCLLQNAAAVVSVYSLTHLDTGTAQMPKLRNLKCKIMLFLYCLIKASFCFKTSWRHMQKL